MKSSSPKLRARPVEADYDDVDALLRLSGWERKRQRGSHVSYGKAGVPEIFTLPAHGGKVKRAYLDKLGKLLGWETED